MRELNKTVMENNIKSLMASNGLKQPQVAIQMNMSQSNFSKKVCGHIQFTLEEAFQLANILKVDVEMLWSEKGAIPAVEVKEEKAPTETEMHPRIPVIEEAVCRALAQIFKYADLKTKVIEHQEPVFIEDKDDYGRYTGIYVRKYYDDKRNDPVNKYHAVFFPRYYELATAFDDEDQWQDYMTDIQYNGNLIESNAFINTFLEQLITLSEAYESDKMTREAYIFSINSNLEKTLSGIQK